MKKVSPPAWTRWLLLHTLGAEAEPIARDLDDLYTVHAARDGEKRANRWYVRQAAGCILRIGVGGRFAASTRDLHEDERRRGGFEAWREMRLAARAMTRSRVYALTIVVALGVGVAGITIVYSLASWVLLRPAPGITNPQSLALIQLELGEGGSGPGGGGFPFSNPDAAELTSHAADLGEFTAVTSQEVHFGAGRTRNAERIAAQFVWPNYFEVLGTRLEAGRTLRHDSLERVLVVSDALARRFWGSTHAAVGAVAYVNGDEYHVVGVAPAEFHGTDVPGEAEMWLSSPSLPILLHSPRILENPMAQVWSTIVARPRAGVRATQIAAVMNNGIPLIKAERRVHSFMMRAAFHGYDGVGASVYLRDELRHTMRVIGLAAAVLLLLACANAANLGFARAASTTADAAIRRALGATRLQVMRERMMETILLGFLAGCLSTLMTVLALRVLKSFSLMRGEVSLSGIHMQSRALFVSFVVALGAAAVAGIVPSLIGSKGATSVQSRKGARGERGTNRTRSMLVVMQLAMSIVLVVWASLLGRTLWNLRNINFGFSQHGVTQFSVDPELQGYDEARQRNFMRNLINDLQARPEVAGAALTDHGVFDHFTFPASILTDDPATRVFARRVQMSPGLTDVLGIPIVAGRAFDSEWLTRDTTTALVGMLNEAGVRVLMPGMTPGQAVGRMIRIEAAGKPQDVLITAVVRNARLSSIDNRDSVTFYQPWSQGWMTGEITVFVRARDGRSILGGPIRDVVHQLDPALPVYGLRTLEQDVDAQISEQRFVARIAMALACTGIVLAMLGIYGSLSYMVQQRTAEMGVRAALGARPSELLAVVMQNGLALATIGTVAGLIVAFNLSRLLASRLYGVAPFDAMTYLGGGAVVLIVAAAASAVPGWRASRVDPITALRHD